MSSCCSHTRDCRMPRRVSHRLTFTVGICGLWLLVGVPAAPAQDKDPKLAAVLARVSFNGAEKPGELGKALAELEPAELAALCDTVVEPGTGDDTKARMALQGLTWYVGSAGTAEQRTKYVQALCTALDSDQPAPVRPFLIQQLQMIGDERAVPALAPFLGDDELCDFAALALLAIGGEEASKVFREALPAAEGQRCIAIIDALGSLRDQQAAPQLARYAASEDRATKWAAAAALARIGDQSGIEGTADSLLGDSWFDRSQYRALWFQLAEGLAQRGEPVLSAEALHRMLEPPTESRPVHVKCAILYGLAEAQGAEAVDKIVEAMTADDLELRAAAAEIAVTLSGAGATAAFVDELERGEAAPATRAAILNVLDRRGDATALPAVLQALHDADKAVRLAAVSAAARLGQDRAVDPLVAFLNRDDAEQREAAKRALVGIENRWPSRAMARAMDSASPRVRTALLDVLARRRATGQIRAIFRQAEHPDQAVRIAAINAVEALGGERATYKVLELLAQAESDRERRAIERALVATCRRSTDPPNQAAPILAAIQRNNTKDYCSLLRVLGQLGGAKALVRIRTALNDDRDEVRGVAFRALLDWPDPDAADDILRIARQTQDLKYHVLAMRAYARLVSLNEDRPSAETVRMYTRGMEAARRVEEKKLLLSKLGAVHDPQTLPLLEQYLHDETLRDEAASAMIRVADGLLPEGWAEARAALDQALAATDVDSVRQQAAEVSKRVAEFEDFITDWRVAGPYTEPTKKGTDLFDVPFPPEQADAKGVQWHEQPLTRDPARYWFIDLNANRSIAGGDRAAYLATRVYSPKTQEVVLEVGSDDGIKIWLNGEVVHSNNVLRGCARGQDKVPVNLVEGWNELLVKVTNNGGAFAATVRVRSPKGEHLTGVRVEAEPGD